MTKLELITTTTRAKNDDTRTCTRNYICILGYKRIDTLEAVCSFVEAHLDYIYKLIQKLVIVTELESDEE